VRPNPKIPSLKSDMSFHLEFRTILLMEGQSNAQTWIRFGGSFGTHSSNLQSFKFSDFKLER
jgi:hypothetical protein